MKSIRRVLFVALLAVTSSIANAELISNIPLDSSRYELMDLATLTHYANNNNTQAQFFLAKRLQKGQNVARDSKNALYWYTRAANQGIAPAQLNLGIMYLRGEGVKADQAKARVWLEKAAHLGDNRASFALAILDEKDKKLVDAYKWYDLSARDAMLDDRVKNRAKGKIGELALNLSASEIESAKKQANVWFQNQ